MTGTAADTGATKAPGGEGPDRPAGPGRWRLPRPTATGQGLALFAIALYAVGVALGYQPLVTLAAAALVALVAAVALVLWRPQLQLTRSFHPKVVTAGEPAVALLEVRNGSRWPSAPVVATDTLGGRQVRLAVRALRPGDSALVRYQLPTARRGRVALGPMGVRRVDPLGLVESGREQGRPEVLWVHPRVWPMAPLPAGFVVDLEGPVSESALSGSVTFSTLREYVPGDDRRQIHWRSSARLDTLLVRQHVDTNEPRATVLLDTRASMWTERTFEDGCEVAASVAAGMASVGHSVAVRVLGLDPARARRLGVGSFADSLAAAEMLDEVEPAGLLGLAAQGAGGGALVVVSGLLEPAVELLLGRQGRYAPIIVCSVAPGLPAGWRRRRDVTLVRGPSAATLAQAWNRMNLG